MKTSTFWKGIPMLSRASVLAGVLLAALALTGAGCDGGLTDDNLSEGKRCNAYSTHNDCASGLVCAGYAPATVSIPNCPETYCCAVDSNNNITSTHPNCQVGCNGGSYSIAIAGFSGSCSSSAPNPLCACFSPPVFVYMNQWALVPDAAPGCGCFTQQDPVACLAALAEAGADSGGSSGDGTTE